MALMLAAREPGPLESFHTVEWAKPPRIVRAELGADTTALPAADPALQIDVPEALAEVTA